MRTIILSLLILFSGLFAFAQTGSITNIKVLQRPDGSGMIDVYFDLNGEANSFNILVEVSFDGGNTYTPVPSNFLEGDTGPVSPGEQNHITWSGQETFPNIYSTEATLKIIATAIRVSNTGKPCPDMPTFTDPRDGNVYNTVQIGNQCWLKENLRYLPKVSPSSSSSNTDPYYYVYHYQGTNVLKLRPLKITKTMVFCITGQLQ